MNDTDARLWHPWLRINRVLRAMLRTRWTAEAWAHVRIEFRRALALKSEIRRAGWFNWRDLGPRRGESAESKTQCLGGGRQLSPPPETGG
jgi:hypothetical protein